jgi:hypothetical protein
MAISSFSAPPLPEPNLIRIHVLESLSRYWAEAAIPIASLPIDILKTSPRIEPPLRLVSVALPDWARKDGVNEEILIPTEAQGRLGFGGKTTWQNVDWFMAAFLLLECWHERIWEYGHGPIHSYSFRLKEWDARAWSHAWVNRIALFLRCWAAHNQNTTPEALFGPLPASNVLMTHDVDAVEKTLAIRLKQSAFNAINALRLLARGKPKASICCVRQCLRFLFGKEDWWQFDLLLSAEAAANIQSLFNFHADLTPKTLKRWLFDPGYDIKQPRIKTLIAELHRRGHQIGLHPGFESWDDLTEVAEQKRNLESISGVSINACRQHWLRFSWQATWSSQEQGGLHSDTTLMFNDRPGFRNSSALRWQPWNAKSNTQHQITAQPSVLMDSHLYDYQPFSDAERRSEMRYWLAECQTIHGEVAVLWHPHTLTKDYGWESGFNELLTAIIQMRQV